MIPRFLRPERVPLVSLERVPAPSICAWCSPDAVVPAGTSHGMCQACSDAMIFDAMHATDAAPVDEAPADRDEDAGAMCGAGCGWCGRCS